MNKCLEGQNSLSYNLQAFAHDVTKILVKTSTFWAKDVCVEVICCRVELCSYFYAVASHTGHNHNILSRLICVQLAYVVCLHG